jgi:hypothetical protein
MSGTIKKVSRRFYSAFMASGDKRKCEAVPARDEGNKIGIG